MQPYLYNSGLKKLAKESLGNEKIHMGIRPFGFHAGNLVSLYVYPYLLCEEVEKLRKPVNFTFFISINDYEQDELDGPNYRQYPFNIYPKNTIIKFTQNSCSCHQFTIDHWFPIIEKSINALKARFPNIQIHFIKNSELKNEPIFKKILLNTIQNPNEQLHIYKQFTKKEILEHPIQFACVICFFCKKSRGETTILDGDYIEYNCFSCKERTKNLYSTFDYWFYHKPLFAARMNIFDIDISLSGDDHFIEGDYEIRKGLLDLLTPGTKHPKMFFAPLVLTSDGFRMSKTQKNTQFGSPNSLVDYCRNFQGNKIQLTDSLILKDITKHEDYPDFF